MKKIGTLLFIALLALNLTAQDNMFAKGDKVVNLGIGFGGHYYSSFSSGYSKIPFFSGSVDVGVVDGVLDEGTIGVGGYIGYTSSKWESGYDYGWKETDFVIGPRGTFNYPFIDNLDTYIGILLGFHSVSFKETGNWYGYPGYSSASSGIYFSGFVGARYYFNDKFAVMLELGSGGLSLASVGVAVKL
jgi:hypothetical protein